MPRKPGTYPGGFNGDHPTIVRMKEIIMSTAGRRAAAHAADSGWPALAGVDEMLRDELGADYGKFDTGSWAGSLVAKVMREAGYRSNGTGQMPRGSVARSALLFTKDGAAVEPRYVSRAYRQTNVV